MESTHKKSVNQGNANYHFKWIDVTSLDTGKFIEDINNPVTITDIERKIRYNNRKLFALVMALLLLVQTMPLPFAFAEGASDAQKAETTVSEEVAKEEPAPEPKAEPAPEPKAEPASEPKEEPAPEPAAEPAAEEDTSKADQAEPAQDAGASTEEEAASPEESNSEEAAPSEAAEEKEDKDIEDKEEEEKYPAQTLTANAGGVKVTLKAPEGALPEGSKLNANQVGQQYINAVENTLEAQGRELTDAVAIDVTPVNKDGKEIQPKKTVSVTFSGTGLDLEAGDEVDVWRVSDDASSVTNVGGSGSANSQTFSTSHFTIYVAGGSTRDPNGDGSRQPNSESHPYVLAPGATVTLNASTSSSTWVVDPSSSYIDIRTTTTTTAQVTNRNTTVTDQLVSVRHHPLRDSDFEYYYILAKANNHTVTYMLKDAGADSFATDSTQTVSHGGTATPPSKDETKTVDGVKYEFDGWYTDQACSEEADFTNITEDKTFYAQYVKKGYEVEFKLKDATADDFETVKTETVEEGGTATAPEEQSTKTVDGKKFEFRGWFEDEACTQDADLTNITSAKTFYAQYTLMKHTVTFMFKDVGEDSFTKEEETEVYSGSDVTAPSHDGTKTVSGVTYEFSGWCKEESCSTSATLTNITEDMTVYSRYAPDVTLTYYANSGTDAADLPRPPVVVSRAGTKVTLGSATREGHHFTGWNTAADGSGDAYAAGAEFTLPESDVDLYAQWSNETIKVTYYRNYDSSDTTVFYSDDEVPQDFPHYEIIDDMPTRASYLFLGWAKTADADPETADLFYPGNYFPTGTDDLSLYAIWGQYDESALFTKELTAYGEELVYDGQPHSLYNKTVDNVDIGVKEVDNPHSEGAGDYKYPGYVRVGNTTGEDIHHIYAKVDNIKASGTDAGTYSAEEAAPLFTHNQRTGNFTELEEYIPVNEHDLVIKPVEITVSTESARKRYDGNALTAGGTIKVGDGTEQPFTSTGTVVTLVNGETLKIKTTGSQTEKGSSENGYEINWGDSSTTAKALNYNINEGTIGTLEVYENMVAYNGNAGDDTSLANMPEGGAAEATYKISDKVPTRSHYDFVEWNTDLYGEGDSYDPGDDYTFTEGVNEVTFYAQWEPKVQKFTYDPNGGSFRGKTDPTDVDEEYDDETEIAEAATREHYKFTGWNTKADGTGTSYNPGDKIKVVDDAVFYAQWEQIKGKYTWSHYFRNEGGYSKTYWTGTEEKECPSHESAEVASGTKVKLSIDTYDGYTNNGQRNIIEGTVCFGEDGKLLYILDDQGNHIQDPDGSGDLKEFRLYYGPNITTVKYEWEGTYPTAPTDLTGKEPEQTTRVFGQKVYIDKTYSKDVTEVDGQLFQGWQFHREIPIETDSGGEYFRVPNLSSVTLYGNWGMDEGFYTFKHYFEQGDGSYAAKYWNGSEYVDCPGHMKPASTGDLVDLTSYDEYTGYEAYPSHPDTVNKGTVEIDVAGNVEAILDENNQVIQKDGENVTEFGLYYKLKRYTVTYSYDGTTPANPNKPADKTKGYVNAYYGQTIDDVYKLENGNATFAKDENFAGYIFQGWETRHESVELDGTKLLMPARNVDLIGTWEPATDTQYTVEYYLQDLNADTYTQDEDETENKTGTTDTDAVYDPKDFYGFSFEKVEYENEGGKITGDESQVVRVYYTRDKFKVTFDPNGGEYKESTDPTVEEFYYEEAITAPTAEETTRSHYVLKEWNTRADGEGSSFEPGSERTFGSDVKFYAIWERDIHKLYFDPNGGKFRGSEEATEIEYKCDSTITIPEAPVREGYKFLYWKGSEYYPGDAYKVEDDHVFVAQWEEEKDDPIPPEDDEDEDTDEEEEDDEEEEAKPAVIIKSSSKGGGPGTGDRIPVEYFYTLILSMLAIALILSRRETNVVVQSQIEQKLENVEFAPYREVIRISETCNFTWIR